MATHSNIFAWEIPWTEEPGRLQSMGCKELDTTEQLTQRTQKRYQPCVPYTSSISQRVLENSAPQTGE